MAKKNRKPGKTTDRYDGYTVTRWIDTNAGNTEEERIEYWARTREERYNSGIMNGIGFRSYDPENGEVSDYTFDSMDDCKAYMKHFYSLENMYERQLKEGKEIDYNQPPRVRFDGIGIGEIDLRHPNAEKFVDLAFDLLFAMRCNEITENEAAVCAMTAYMFYQMDEMPDAA